ncbi:UDP-glucose 4-epimerase [candidate division LCP-89 bacterium B3_LCP]|uniref:UDP-glucose 4-epimerase n=1 Tax=candidate division LCP-89 bacterium B3_LCP TaxID=2012998 RepID=A0A532V310_UNCL8|nr:MAG: UDP-glucose 4-epimerase [candidate division LCP-89 bacterium B3_LCP]
MKSLVTGGAGFMGSHLADYLLKMGHQVIVLDDLSGGFTENVPSEAHFTEGTILDRDLIDSLCKEHNFDYIFHLAAYAAEGLSHFIKHFNYQNNLIGSVNLINAAVNYKVKRFIFTSSIAVYGVAQLPMTEEMVPSPEDSYGIAKFAVEMELRATAEMFGLDYVIFRPHNVYGERQNIGDKYRNVVGIFMNQILQGQPMTIFGDGEQSRAFSYIDDVVPVIARSAAMDEARNQIFNVGADKPYSVNQLAHQVADAMDVEPNLGYLPARNEVAHAFSDHSKVERVFNYSPEIDLEEGIRRVAAWIKQHGARQSKEFGNIEITENLPPSWT